MLKNSEKIDVIPFKHQLIDYEVNLKKKQELHVIFKLFLEQESTKKVNSFKK